MDTSGNPYEQKLYQLFISHDVNSKGYLDMDSLSKLCRTLELRDREQELIACLLNDDPSSHVTFDDFKDGLLKLLGTGSSEINSSNYGKYLHYKIHIFID